ncbi:GvpL/GvpF family gas vesicle protein [bacterium]|nr:GvpL/GvpF family gas vesicle protein [bacterium]
MAATSAIEPETAPVPEVAGEPVLGRYIYCIIDCDEPKDLDCGAIGDAATGRYESPLRGRPRGGSRARVYTVVHNGVAVVVSPSLQSKYTIDRQNTLAHQRVMEHVMEQGHTVLPVKFDTIAEAKNGAGPEERIVEQVLAKRFEELSSLLALMSTRVEMGVKALWRDKKTVFREIVDSDDEIKRLRRKLVSQQGEASFGLRVKLGELVKNALGAKKEREQKELRDAVRDLVVDLHTNKTFGDQMFANLALLLDKSRVEALDRKLDELADAAPERIGLRYVGPVPPSDFIELAITWDE